MKKQILILLAFTFALAGSAQAQFGRVNSASFNSISAKLLGDNTAFTADMEAQMPSQQIKSMPCKIAFDNGKCRFEMNFSEIKSDQMPPRTADRMKAMGMDKATIISRPDKKTTYTIYPGLSAYLESPLQDVDATKPDSAFKITTTELSRESFDGHACVKNKVVITDDQGKSHESIVWDALDLKKFPIKIESNEQGRNTSMLFTNLKLSQPDAALFEPPSDYKKLENQQALNQEMMLRMKNMVMPAGHP